MSNPSISKLNKGVLEPAPKPSQRKMQKIIAKMQEPVGTYARIRNKILAKVRREQDLLMRDARRGHHSTRIKRALRRAAQPEQTNDESTKPTNPTKEG